MQRENELLEALGASLRKRGAAIQTPVPVNVERSIRMALSAKDDRPQTAPWYVKAWQWLTQPAVSFAMAGTVSVVLVAVFMYSRSMQTELPSEVTSAALKTFHWIHDLHDALDVASTSPTEIQSYLQSKGISNRVFFPEIDAKLAGAKVYYINSQPCVELVYNRGEHTVALLEVEEATFGTGRVEMNPEVRQDVEKSRWHWASTQENGTLFVWKSNSIVCTVVSDLQIDEISALIHLEAL